MAYLQSSRMARFFGFTVFILASSNAWGQACSLNSLQVDPPMPGATDSVTVMLSFDCANSCFAPCGLTQELIADGHYLITAFVHDETEELAQQGITCTQVVVSSDQEVVLGVLPAGSYLVSVDLRVGSSSAPCTDGTTVGQTSTTFDVPGLPVPAVSEWGLAILVLLLLQAGTIQIRRKYLS